MIHTAMTDGDPDTQNSRETAPDTARGDSSHANAQPAAADEARTDGWAELYTTSMGGVSITYYENGVVKRVYPGDALTFTFPDGRAEQFGIDDTPPYPPPEGVVVPVYAKPGQRTFVAVLFGTLVKGLFFGVLIFVTYLVATVYIF